MDCCSHFSNRPMPMYPSQRVKQAKSLPTAVLLYCGTCRTQPSQPAFSVHSLLPLLLPVPALNNSRGSTCWVVADTLVARSHALAAEADMRKEVAGQGVALGHNCRHTIRVARVAGSTARSRLCRSLCPAPYLCRATCLCRPSWVHIRALVELVLARLCRSSAVVSAVERTDRSADRSGRESESAAGRRSWRTAGSAKEADPHHLHSERRMRTGRKAVGRRVRMLRAYTVTTCGPPARMCSSDCSTAAWTAQHALCCH